MRIILRKEYEEKEWKEDIYNTYKSSDRKHKVGTQVRQQRKCTNVYYEVHYGQNESVPYKFETYEDAFEFCNAWNGGTMTSFVREVCNAIDGVNRERSYIGKWVTRI